MAKHFRITNGKETQVVCSLEGYEDWQLLNKCERLPTECEEWDNISKNWKVCAKQETELKRQVIAKNPKSLLARIEAIEAHLGLKAKDL